jgi:predicted RNA polymerase sigma factor
VLAARRYSSRGYEAAHAKVASDETEWSQSAAPYGVLLLIARTRRALNHAVTVAMTRSIDDRLQMVDDEELSSALAGDHLLHAAGADLLLREVTG